MALAITTTSDLELDPTAKALTAPLPTPYNAPAYVAPTNPIIPQAPTMALPPDGQTMGKGGTSFGSVPPIYILPPVIRYDTPDAGYDELPYRPPKVVPQPLVEPTLPGTKAVMPVPVGQQPAKVPVPAVVASVETPGPITGTVAGYDLARVPLWAWLVGAAVIGSKVLK